MSLSRIQTVGPWQQTGAYDPNPPYFATGAGGSYTSGTFNASANSILVVAVVLSGAGNHTVSNITNTGTPLTWTRLNRARAAATPAESNVELWYALNSGAQTGITYTVNWTETGGANYTGHGRGFLWEFTGHDTTTPFADNDIYLGTFNETKPVTTVTVTQVTGGVILGGITDGGSGNTISSSTADVTGGMVNRSGDQTTAFHTRGVSNPLSAGSYAAIVDTPDTNWTFVASFGVLQPSTGGGGGGGGSKRGVGIVRF